MEASKEEIREHTEARCREIKDVANGYLGMKFNVQDLRDDLTAFLVDSCEWIAHENAGQIELAIKNADSFVDWCDKQLYHEFVVLTKARGKYVQSIQPIWMSGAVYRQPEIDKRYHVMVEAAKHVTDTLTTCREYLRNMYQLISRCPSIDDRVTEEVLNLLKHFAIYDSFMSDETNTLVWRLDWAMVKREGAYARSRYHYAYVNAPWLSEI